MAGFSLLEVLASLVLLSILLVGVYSGLRTATQTVRAGTEATQRLDQIRAAQQLLHRELAQALAIPIGSNGNGDSLFFSGDAQSMSYVAPLPGYLGKLGAQLQTLKLVDDGHQGMSLQLQLASLSTNGQPPKPMGPPQVLVDHVSAGQFAYRGIDSTGQVSGWRDNWPDGRLMPSLVRIELHLRGRYAWPTLDAPLRIDPASGQLQQGFRQRAQLQGGTP